jgi:hypothetical protein
MVLFAYILINLFVVVFFFKYQVKRLHVLEILFYWFTSSLLVQNQSALLFMNFKYITIPDVVTLELAHLMNRTVLYPYLTFIFLNQYITLITKWTKLVMIFTFTLLLVGMDGLSVWLGIVEFVKWNFFMSALFWFCYLIIAIAIMKLFQKKLYKVAET